MTSPDEMQKESLSALMDNQASDLELRRILKQFPEDESIGSTWRRYQLAAAVMHRQETAFLAVNLSEAVSKAIAFEPALMSSASKSAPIWLRWGGKSALAASVAIAVLIGAQQFAVPTVAPLAVSPAVPSSEINFPSSNVDAPTNSLAQVPESTLADTSQVQSAPEGFSLPTPMARTVSNQAERVQSLQVQPVSLNQTDWRNDPEVQAQLNQMLLDHANRSAGHGSFGLLPFTRVPSLPADVSLNNAAEPAAGTR